MPSELSPELWFAAADAAILAVALLGYFELRGLRVPTAADIPSAFAVLEDSIRKYAPGMPFGYSWGEAFRWLKAKGVKADWDGVEKTLEGYEGFRYGGKPLPDGGKDSVLVLCAKVRRSMIGKGTKG